MNAKRAKRLRREAEAATVGKPAAGYQPGRQSRHVVTVLSTTGDERVAAVTHQTFHVHPDTTRGVYHVLKRKG